MALVENVKRAYEINEDFLYGDIPLASGVVIHEGAALGTAASGFARPPQPSDKFIGFATMSAVNPGSDGAEDVRARQKGVVILDVVGVVGEGDIEAPVYLVDDDTFTLADGAGANAPLGRVIRFVGGTTCAVRFEADQIRSSVPA